MARKAWTAGADFRPLASRPPALAEGDVVFAGYGIVAKDLGYDDYAGLDVKDKVVLVLRYGPDGDDEKSTWSPFTALRFKAPIAREKGAKALLVARARSRRSAGRLVALRTDAAFADAGVAAALGEAARRRGALRGLGDGRSTPRRRRSTRRRSRRPSSLAGARVAADRRRDARSRVDDAQRPRPPAGGRAAPNAEVVVVGAHYDHLGLGGADSLAPGARRQIHHGADDNASGVAARPRDRAAPRRAREPAPAVRSSSSRSGPRRMGTLGSPHFTKNPTVPLEKVAAMLNLDMVGRLARTSSTSTASAPRRLWKPLVEEANAAPGLKLKLLEGGFGPSDHPPFYAAGRPVLFVFTGAHADYHRPSDTADKFDAEGDREGARGSSSRSSRPSPRRPSASPSRAVAADKEGARRGARGFRVWVGCIPDYSEEGRA